MGKSRAGRKRKSGDRYPSGRLRPVYDRGCDGVQRRRAAYATPANSDGKANSDHTFDAIGRAWSAGLLVVEGRDPAVIRDAGRDLAALYWRIYGLGSRDSLARFQAQTAGMSSAERERALEGALNHRLALLGTQASEQRRAVDALCIGDGLMVDSGPVWLDRLIWARRHDRPELAGDRRVLDLALKGLALIT